MSGVGRAWAAVAGAIVLASCADSPAPPSPSMSAEASPPPVVDRGGVSFPRTLQADRMVEVQVETPGEQPGIVVSVALDSPYFGPSGTVPTNVRLAPGWKARLRVPLGPALCPAGSGSSVATVEVRAYDGDQVKTHEVTLADEALAEINADECRQRIATDAAAPSFGDPARSGDGVDSVVLLERGSSSAAATLTALSGNVIFSLEPAAGDLPFVLAPDEPRASIPVTMTASRCDAHALAESKKTFIFTASYEIDGQPITVEYRADGEMEQALQELIDSCADASDSEGIGGQ